MKNTKHLILAVVAVFLITATIFTTIAYLTSKQEVKNTFTVGNVVIGLDEALVKTDGTPDGDLRTEIGNQYHLLPGMSYTKDPTVTVKANSEDCYVRMVVTVTHYDELEALRGEYDVLTGKDNDSIEFHEVRGTEGLKEATYNIAGLEIKVAVASGASNAKLVMDKIASGEADWTFVEIMGCPGGCVNGGGQPIQPQSVRDTVDLKATRAAALYDQDRGMEMRKSHNNPVVKEVYDNYFKGAYGCHAAHHALHTSYTARKKFNF